MTDAPEPRWPLGIPTRLRPLEVLARGSNSVLWRARDVELGVDVAVKVLVAAAGDRGRARPDPARRIEVEARALARLRGVAGVVVIHELGRTTDGAAWLACELLPGGTLAQQAPLASAEVAGVGAQVATALAAAHRLDVHHGDISPSNIVFSADGAPLLADFGLADLGSPEGDPGGLTPAFAAPERLRGAPPSAASDVHSLAATLDSVWSGPGRGSPVALDAGLRDLLQRSRAAAPAERPTAAELADGLRSLVPR